MYLAQNTAESNLFAIVIRGTDFEDIDDIIEDIDVFSTTTYPYVSSSDPSIQISNGANDGLSDLINMQSSSPSTDAVMMLTAFLASDSFTSLLDQSNSTLSFLVTGHSLGRALATVFTSYLIDTFTPSSPYQLNLKPYTFASPSVGNQTYVDYYNN